MSRAGIVVALSLCAATVARAQATLDVRTEPPGATIVVDGVPKGTSPDAIPVAAGRHTVVFALDGYVPDTHEVTVGRGRTKLYVRLARAGAGGIRVRDEDNPSPAPGMGLVIVATEPPGLTVILNEQKVERRTPVTFDISPGSYSVVIAFRGVPVLTTRTEVKAGWRVQLRRNLVAAVREAERTAEKSEAGAQPGGPRECACAPPGKLKACVEKRGVCTYRPEGRGAGHAECTRCGGFRRVPRPRRADAERACDTREGRGEGCPCPDIGRVLRDCLEPEVRCRRRCGAGG